ncbi:MAG: 2'-5' RNA ligase [halophilic archaeon J07HX64]|jgi:2''-5'' RNA ligase|nr:MAG: 2'-5' RNA ligase [halophilic archaeon J07HX64]
MRLFVSVDVGGLAAEIAAVQRPFADASGLRLTDPRQAHVTLKFLGDTRAGQLPDLREAIAAAVADSGISPFRTEVGGFGVFPGLEYLSVVWLGVREGSEQLTALHERIESRTTAMGFNPEEHAFTPHVTLARMDHADNKERVQELVETRDPTAGALTVDAVCLTESTLTSDGPVYETVERFDLPR